MQARELNRIVQQAAAYRLAQDLKRRVEAAQQAEVNTQQLEEVLHQARLTVARQRSRLDQLEKLNSQTAAHWQAENRRVENNITLLRRRIEELRLANQQLEEERKQLALKELNQEELVRDKIRMTAWTLADRQQTKQVEIKRTQRNTNPDPKAAVVEKADKPTKKRVKANFSRYAQENRGPGKNQLMPGYP
jgi:hypothetical protein